MADIIDQAAELQQHIIDVAIMNRKPAHSANGKCLWCDEHLESKSAQFCPGGDCAADYEMYRRRNGGF